MKIHLKNSDEIKLMKESAEILSEVFQKALALAIPGAKCIDIEKFADKEIKKMHASASFKTVENYQYASCICVNDAVVHGIPNEYVLQKDDIFSLDMGVLWKGWHSDASWSIIVGQDQTGQSRRIVGNEIISKDFQKIQNPKERFLEAGITALHQAVNAAREGNYVWDISQQIQQVIEKQAGYHIVHPLTGHGIGKDLHEDPFVPGFVAGKRENSPKIVSGMVLAIEIIYGEKTGEVWYGNDDGWTIATRDGSNAGLFEVTVAIIKGKPVILTHIA